ncbi:MULTISPECIES: Bor/Iss family lipoprotein [unclassified Colwellia]|uniref:Bor/Iss family lipoprotein n=1 Tax=unclassified Colwellia TaxID=196834 RepID=UPI0015F46CF4|nr:MULTISPECIES: hypothetical protein [unclassified Colwellia]MBA6357970.1 hypothetical protein [Colwellia sp. BRX8-3]MBA6361481.1 hypothetical protein [Colwellia sp. BRX8-6]MBA6367199.1 hypothetical protein [Colwellia sp. BRX8-5]MBA6377035.1 hypothetical protein [Colwellia sp. BRX8-2]|tara:strand:+ start:1110 stop:1406 length:297 start_codon:yes stop_codon:yes gene_type:complete
MKNILLGVLCVTLFSGCSTIHFDKGDQVKSNQTTQLWHHNFALSLYEGSPVVDLQNECGNTPWASVKTELTFINGLASGAVNMLGPIWYPKTVEVSCK